MDTLINATFGGRLRVRVAGLLLEDNRLLLLKLRGVGKAGYLWCPPSGGMTFGESATEALMREFQEETALPVSVGELAFVYEFLAPPLHALELFFWVGKTSEARPTLGTDPELPASQQILTDWAWFSIDALRALPADTLHEALRGIKAWEDLDKRLAYTRSA